MSIFQYADTSVSLFWICWAFEQLPQPTRCWGSHGRQGFEGSARAGGTVIIFSVIFIKQEIHQKKYIETDKGERGCSDKGWFHCDQCGKLAFWKRWTSKTANDHKLQMIINYRKAKERTSQNEIRFREGGVRVEGEGGGQSGVRESYTAQSVVIFAPLWSTFKSLCGFRPLD